MGIQGLIPFLKKATKPANIKEFKGCTVAIDSYCWLHRGAFACAEKLALGEKTDQYVFYCMKYVNALLSFDIKPVMVFDGCRLPSKRDVEQARKERRNANRKKAAQLLREGKRGEARDCLAQCVDISAEMALELMNACREKGVDCIVAPYEADSQLAYLNKIGVADVIVTEDSDLALFGCEKIMFKMDVNGNGLLLEQSRLGNSFDLPADQFTFDKFRKICILSGCDYLPSLPGIGLVKATKVFKLSRQADMRQMIKKMPAILKMSSLVIPEDYADNFLKAENTFLYQLVYDPLQRKLVPLNPYPPGLDPSQLHYAGPMISEEKAYQIAIGNINVNTGERMSFFDPDNFKPKTNSFNQDITLMMKNSIWSKEYSRRTHKSIQGQGSSPLKKQEIPVDRPSTKGKEVSISINGQLKSRFGHRSNVPKDGLISVESLPSEGQLLQIYSSGFAGETRNGGKLTPGKEMNLNNSDVLVESNKFLQSPGFKNRTLNGSVNADKENSDESSTTSPVKLAGGKTPKKSETPNVLLSPSRRNIFAVKSADKNGGKEAASCTPGNKTKFSLDGTFSGGSGAGEVKSRFFVASPKPARESEFFIKLKQNSSNKKNDDNGIKNDDPEEHDAGFIDGQRDETPSLSVKSASDLRSRLSVFNSGFKNSNDVFPSSSSSSVTKEHKDKPVNFKRSLFSSLERNDVEKIRDDDVKLCSTPKRMKLDGLVGDKSDVISSGGLNISEGVDIEDVPKNSSKSKSVRSNVFAICKDNNNNGKAVGNDRVQSSSSFSVVKRHSMILPSSTGGDCDFESENPFDVIDDVVTDRCEKNFDAGKPPSAHDCATRADETEDPLPLNSIYKKRTDTRPTSLMTKLKSSKEPPPSNEIEKRKSLFSLDADYYEEEGVVISDDDTEDPLLPVRWSASGKPEKNVRIKASYKTPVLSKGCKPSGLSKQRGRSKKKTTDDDDDDDPFSPSLLKQSSLSNFFRSNFAHSKELV